MDNKHLSEEEKQQAENDFLKMKLMLEHGADFYVPEESKDELSPDAENAFLNHIVEWERQFAERKTTTIFERLGKPQNITPVDEIPDDAIEEKWNEISGYMRKYRIELSACSPNITTRELYRFTTEELFFKEMQDICISGMMSSFIYDEFYPDHEYDNTRYAIQDCIKPILTKESLEFTLWYAKNGISLNGYSNLSEEELKEIVNTFKQKHENIDVHDISNVECKLEKDTCIVSGTHDTMLDFGDAHANVLGEWSVVFVQTDGFWSIVKVEIEGIGL